jgi:hypothetical protein
MIESVPQFMQGVFTFTGAGYDTPAPLGVRYTVPSDKRSQTIYFRAGNSTDAMVAVVLLRDGKPMRYFPVGARAAVHVPLSVVEDLEPEQTLEAVLAAPAGISGTLVLDIGLLEI